MFKSLRDGHWRTALQRMQFKTEFLLMVEASVKPPELRKLKDDAWEFIRKYLAPASERPSAISQLNDPFLAPSFSSILTARFLSLVQRQYPSHEKYLNKKIDMYDEISIVAGKDIARGNFSKTFGDIQTNSSGQPSTIEVEPTKSDSATSLEPRYHKKRSRVEEEEGDLRHISTQLGEVVSALKKFSDNQLDVEKLYGEFMKMDDVDEAVRVAAFDHLVEREMLARAFLTKSEALRKLWNTTPTHTQEHPFLQKGHLPSPKPTRGLG